MNDKEFSRRLNQACDGHPHVPAYGQGRQTWVSQQMKVSVEAVRKWFSGEARPRPGKMKLLAQKLEVDEAWLSLGIIPDMHPDEKKARNAEVDGAVNVIAGLIQMNGGKVAFPSDKDTRNGYVDLYAIIRGTQYGIHVSLAKEVSPDVYLFTVPKEFDHCKVVGCIHSYPMRLTTLNLTHDLIEKHKVRRGGYFEIQISRKDNEYWTGKDNWPRISSLADRI